MELAGRLALVTGASMGLGRRFALDLAAAGATVVGIARGAERLADLDAAMGDAGWTRALDVANEPAVQALADEIVDRYGRLDILINNAGIEDRTPVTDLTADDVRRVMRINFEGAVHATLAVVPHMVARSEGWIVGVSSGVSRSPVPSEAAYAASKAALVAFCESISYELAPKGVTVKVLFPGFVADTRMARASVEQGMRLPPRTVHRTAEQVSRALLRNLDAPGFEINASRLEAIAPVFRTVAPRLYRRGVEKTTRS